MSIRGYIDIRKDKMFKREEGYEIFMHKRYITPLFKLGDEFFNCLEDLGLLRQYTDDYGLGEIEICPEDLEDLEDNDPDKYDALYAQFPNEMKKIDEAMDEDMYGVCSVQCL